MTRHPLDFDVPWLTVCRACGKASVVWVIVHDCGGEEEVTRPLDGVCGDPDRCGDRLYGLACETRRAVIEQMLSEVAP